MTRQNGNALWLILIAIALIGGLTAMMTRSSTTSDDTGDYERDTIEVTQIMRYAKSVELGVQALLQRGCGENEISFWTDTNGDSTENASDTYYNPNAPGDRTCHVFAPQGAGLTLIGVKSEWLDSTQSANSGYNKWLFSSQAQLTGVGKDCGSGTKCNEVVILLPFIKKGSCLSINNMLGIASISGNPPKDSATVYNYAAANFPYTGSFATQYVLENLDGHASGCFEGDQNPSGGYHFYHSLIIR